MSRKHVLSLDMLKGISGSMASNITSREIEVANLDKASIHCKWDAGPAGEFQVEVLLDDGDDWFVLNSGAPWEVEAADSEAHINLLELPFRRLRLKWVRTSGSGTLSAFLTSKTVGA